MGVTGLESAIDMGRSPTEDDRRALSDDEEDAFDDVSVNVLNRFSFAWKANIGKQTRLEVSSQQQPELGRSPKFDDFHSAERCSYLALHKKVRNNVIL
jgi:hypothetical protein